jgi:hypothetical protein
VDFQNYYRRLGLQNYPFTTFTTEHETTHAEELFVPMTEYGPIQEAFRSGQNMIILGERGVGKTAVLEEFHRRVPARQVLCTINAFSEIPVESKRHDFHKLILKHLLLAFVKHLRAHPFVSPRLRKADRVLLSYLIYFYSDQLTLESMKEAISKMQIPWWKRLLAGVFNKARLPLNYAGTVLENALKRYIAQTFGAVPLVEETQIREYFPEIKIAPQTEFTRDVDSFHLVRSLSETIQRATGSRPVAVFDKLDEDPRLENDAEIVSGFLLPLLSDNNLLSCSTLQTVLFVWKTPYRYIESKVRSQKFFCPTIRWDRDTLKQVLNRRVAVFSGGQLADYRKMFSDPDGHAVDELFSLANGVPRDLWHLINKVFEEQYRSNPRSRTLTDKAIDTAKTRFVTEFNYYEYYPRKANARRDSMDIYSYYAHLRKVGSEDFSKSRFTDLAGTGSSTTNYLVGMERIGLIEKIRQERGDLIFRIRDSKIVYAINRGIDLRAEV